MTKKEIFLVTGGCGFIGSHIVDKLIEEKKEVVVLDNLSTGTLKNLNHSATFYHGDASDKILVNQIFQQHKFDYVIHQASKINVSAIQEDPFHDLDSSVISTINLSQNCIKFKVKKLIFASSVAVYGQSKVLPASENSQIDPIYSYGISKHTAESYLKYFSRYYKFNFEILRYSNVYGPRQPIFGEVGVIAIYTDKIIKNEPLIIFGNGENLRDYVYVSDVVNFTMHSVTLKGSSIFNVGSGIPTSVNQVFSEFQNQSLKKIKPVYKPERLGEIGSFYCEIGRALKTGWEPNVKLKKGIENTIRFFNNEKYE
jgi:UDP-glucose 4-epimerase